MPDINKSTKVKGSVFMSVLILSIYMLQSTTSPMNVAIASLCEQFPNLSTSTVQLVTTIPTVLALIGNLAFGKLINTLGYKKGLLIAMALVLLGGVMPTFFIDSFAMIVFWRVVLGIGYGFLTPAGMTMIVTFIDPEGQGKLSGFGSAASSISGLLMTLIAGWLLNMSLNLMFLSHLLLAIPFVLMLVAPKSMFIVKNNELEAAQNSQDEKRLKPKISNTTFVWIAFFVISMFLYVASTMYSSLIIAGLGGGASESSIANSCAIAAAFVAGLLFGKLYGKFGKLFLVVACVIVTVGFSLLYLASNMAMFFVAYTCIGFGFMALVPFLYLIIPTVNHPERAASVNGLVLAVNSVFGFFYPYIVDFIFNIFGQTGNMQFIGLVGAVGYVILGVLLIVLPAKMYAPYAVESK